MPATAPSAEADLLSRIAKEASTLPAKKLGNVLNYMLFIKQRPDDEDGDAAWERLLNDDRKTANFAKWAEQALADGPGEPLDLAKL